MLSSQEIVQLSERIDALHRLGLFLDIQRQPNGDYLVSDLVEFHTERFAILTLDGGGNHFVFTAHLLKRLEEVAGGGKAPFPIHKLFDVVAGVSAGAVTTGMLGLHFSGQDILDFWEREVATIFEPRNKLEQYLVSIARDTGFNDIAFIMRLMNLIFLAPVFSKKKLREMALNYFGNRTMRELVKDAGVGLLIQSGDLASGYVNPLGCVPVPGEEPASYLTSDQVLARGAFEAAGSPPMFTQVFGSYTDGGYGTFNDPDQLVLARLMDKDMRWFLNQPRGGAFYKKYVEIQNQYLTPPQPGMPKKNKVAMMSLGVPYLPRELLLESVAQRQFLPGMTFTAHFVLAAYANSSYAQSMFLRQSNMLPWLDFRRFNMNFNASVLHNPNQLLHHARSFLVPGIKATNTAEVTTQDMYFMSMLLEKAYIPFYSALGESVLSFMDERAAKAGVPTNPFFQGLDESLSHFNPNVYIPGERDNNRSLYGARLQSTLGDTDWINGQPVSSPYPNPIAEIFERPLPSFEPPYFQSNPPPPDAYGH